uniref:Uncharacterized protein n=1 Tax=Heliothis virescens TaxID=7102 RepID=A0A2A4J0X5_HELVI
MPVSQPNDNTNAAPVEPIVTIPPIQQNEEDILGNPSPTLLQTEEQNELTPENLSLTLGLEASLIPEIERSMPNLDISLGAVIEEMSRSTVPGTSTAENEPAVTSRPRDSLTFFSPEAIRPLPKGAPRSKSNRGRKRKFKIYRAAGGITCTRGIRGPREDQIPSQKTAASPWVSDVSITQNRNIKCRISENVLCHATRLTPGVRKYPGLRMINWIPKDAQCRRPGPCCRQCYWQQTKKRTWCTPIVLEGAGSVALSSDEESLPPPKRPSATMATRGLSASQSPRDGRGRFVRPKNNSVASEADSEMGVTSDDPGGENCTSLGSSKTELNAAKKEQRKAVAADEVTELSRRARRRRAALAAEGREPSAVALGQMALDGVDLVLKVATKSGSLKDTFTSGLKEAAGDIKEDRLLDISCGRLLNRTTSDEVVKLQEENGRLRHDLEDLRRQVAVLSEQQQRRSPTNVAPAVAPAPTPRPASAHTD